MFSRFPTSQSQAAALIAEERNAANPGELLNEQLQKVCALIRARDAELRAHAHKYFFVSGGNEFCPGQPPHQEWATRERERRVTELANLQEQAQRIMANPVWIRYHQEKNT